MSKQRSENQNSLRPRRTREEIRRAILDATAKLLLKRGPSEITVREIAEAAHVKHPLIFRHFGSKEKLIGAVHAMYVARDAEKVSTIEEIEGSIRKLFGALEQSRWRQIALARAMIDGFDPRSLQNSFPMMEKLLEVLRTKRGRSEARSEFSAEEIGAAAGAMALGWVVFAPFLEISAGLDDRTPEEISDLAGSIIEEFIERFC